MKSALLNMLDVIEQEQLKEFYGHYPVSLIDSYESIFKNNPMEATEQINTDVESLFIHFIPVEAHELKLFYQHNAFIKNQVKSVIYSIEGFGASEDKTRWIMEIIELKLFSMIFKTKKQYDENLAFDKEWFSKTVEKSQLLTEHFEEAQTKPSYQIPKLIFRDLDEIYKFFMATCRFYYGYPEEYFNIFYEFQKRKVS